MNIIRPLLAITGFKKALEFNKATKNPGKTQENLLKRILHKNKDTIFGREYTFRYIKSVKDYRNIVPVFNYDHLSLKVDLVFNGVKRVLTHDPVVYFAMTSGTTGPRKFIPVTKESRKAKSDAMKLWMYYASKDHPNMFNGKILSMVSPEIEVYNEGFPCGSESGHAYQNLPKIIKNKYVVPYSVFENPDYDHKYFQILRAAMEADITFIGTCNPSTVILLCKKMEVSGSLIIQIISDRNPERARELRCLKKLTPEYVWPNLALIGCWKGGSSNVYLKDFPKYFGDTPIRDWGYLASEIRGSIPMFDDGSDGVLDIVHNYYEFKREGGTEFLGVQDLEIGQRYFVYITTLGGLYRYNMKDLLEVTDIYNQTPMVRFIQKGAGMSSITGEKLSEFQVVKAVSDAFTTLNLDLEFIVAVPDFTSYRYHFLIEGELEKSASLLNEIDNNLKVNNIEYKSKRDSGRLSGVWIDWVELGGMEAYRKKKVAEGVPDGQFKMLRLATDLAFLENFKIIRSSKLLKIIG